MLAFSKIVEINLANPKCKETNNIANQRRRKLPKGDSREDYFFVNAKVSMKRSGNFVKRLQKFQTFEQASIIRMLATDLQDIEILTRISERDVIAIEA